jgi:hypothetical protein
MLPTRFSQRRVNANGLGGVRSKQPIAARRSSGGRQALGGSFGTGVGNLESGGEEGERDGARWPFCRKAEKHWL